VTLVGTQPGGGDSGSVVVHCGGGGGCVCGIIYAMRTSVMCTLAYMSSKSIIIREIRRRAAAAAASSSGCGSGSDGGGGGVGGACALPRHYRRLKISFYYIDSADRWAHPLPTRQTHATHTHTHTYIYKCILWICMYVCVYTDPNPFPELTCPHTPPTTGQAVRDGTPATRQIELCMYDKIPV